MQGPQVELEPAADLTRRLSTQRIFGGRRRTGAIPKGGGRPGAVTRCARVREARGAAE